MNLLTVFIRIPILIVLLFGTAQPSPNFFACVIRAHDLARVRSSDHHCCKDTKSCATEASSRSKESIKARPYLPCCESVIPSTSVAEHRITKSPNVTLVSFGLLNIDFSLGTSRLIERYFTPPPKTSDKEILNLNLRI